MLAGETEPYGKGSFLAFGRMPGRAVTVIAGCRRNLGCLFGPIFIEGAAICSRSSKAGLYKHVLKIWNPFSVPS